MTAWAVTQTDRFKAAVMGAGISDWLSFHGKSYLSTWDVKYHGDGDPYDPDGVYRERSHVGREHGKAARVEGCGHARREGEAQRPDDAKSTEVAAGVAR